MKKILLLLLFLPFFGFSQTFGEDGTTWRRKFFYYGNNGPGSPWLNTWDYCYNYQKDTVIGVDTFQLILSFINENLGMSGTNDMDEREALCYLDSGKVYYGKPGEMKLFYDFNLAVGDSLIFFVNYGIDLYQYDTVTVIAVDSIHYNGTFRKRIRFEDFTISGNLNLTYPGMDWVEGVGDLEYGTFAFNIEDTLVHYPIFGYEILCFVENDTTWIGDCDPFSSCSELLEPEIDSSGYSPFGSMYFNAYPNPFQSTLVLSCAFIDSNFTLRIFDAAGRIVHEETIGGTYHLLNLEHLSEGTYVIHVGGEKKSFRTKVIKL